MTFNGADIDTSSLVNEDELNRTYERNLSPEELEDVATFKAPGIDPGQAAHPPANSVEESGNKSKAKKLRSETALRRSLRTSVGDFYNSADTTNSRAQASAHTQSTNTYRLKQSERLPTWIWGIIITVLGVSPASRCISTAVYWFTIFLAVTFSAFGVVFTVYDIASEETATTPHIGFISLLIGFGWICLGIYSFKLAGRLFGNGDFAKSVRAHSRTFFKVSTALLLTIASMAFTGLNLFEGFKEFSPKRCGTLKLYDWVCYALYGSRSAFTVVAMVWNVMVGCILLSVCRTHTIGIRRFVRDLEEDAKQYEDFWRQKIRRSKVGEYNVETASILERWCVYDEEHIGLNAEKNEQQPESPTRTYSERQIDVGSDIVQVPFNFGGQVSTEDSDSSAIGQNGDDIPRYPPIMSQDELLLCYWKISETIAHYAENGSASYVTFLDTSAAFDNVRHYALFYKLHQFGITGKTLRTLIKCYENLKSIVVVNGVQSSTSLPVLQGVRQGGVLSTWFYLLFIDNLLVKLEDSPHGTCVGPIKTGNPTLADDLTLISPTKNSLQEQINKVTQYANKWGYSLNEEKCKFVVFGSKTNRTFTIMIGNTLLRSEDSATHVGIIVNKNMKCNSTIEARIQKARASLFSILSVERQKGDVNPLLLADIVQKVCVPSLLYGCELWTNMTNPDKLKVERFIRLAAKSCQHFPARTRTDMALGMVSWHPIQYQIEKRKLQFLQKLCDMSSNLLVKKLFEYRLHLFDIRQRTDQKGFIPDVYALLVKYDCVHFLDTYLNTATFPSKSAWRRLICNRLRTFYENQWYLNTNSDPAFDTFRTINPDFKPSILWQTATTNNQIAAAITTARLIVSCHRKNEQICEKCFATTDSVEEHYLVTCPAFRRQRSYFLNSVKELFGTDLYTYVKDSDSTNIVTRLFSDETVIRFKVDQHIYAPHCCSFVHSVLHRNV